MTVKFTAQEILDQFGKETLKAVFIHQEWTPDEYKRRLACLTDKSKRKYKPSRVRTGLNSFEMRIVPSRYVPQPRDQNDMFPIKIAVPIHWVFDVHRRKDLSAEAQEILDAYESGLPFYLKELEIETEVTDAKRLGLL